MEWEVEWCGYYGSGVVKMLVMNRVSVICWLFIVSWWAGLALAPLYVENNAGGRGFDLTFNIFVWLFIVLMISLAVFSVISKIKIVLPRRWYFFILFPVFMAIMLLFRGSENYNACVLRLIYIVVGVLFFFSLYQFTRNEKKATKMLVAVVVAGGVQAVVSFFQIYAPEFISGFWPTYANRALGVFQQRNALAVFLVSSIVVGVYLSTRPFMGTKNFFWWVGCYLCFAGGGYIAAYTGSRAGLISFVVSLIVMYVFRVRYIKRNKSLVLIGMVVVVSFFLAGGMVSQNQGFSRVVESTENDLEYLRKSQRMNIYLVAAEMIAERPLSGYGLGSFQRHWNLQVADYADRYPNANITYVTHPHNEILYWIIEMGVGILVIIGIILFTMIVQIKACGVQRGAAYLALLFPISFYSMVEYPFFLSSLHWFLWLFFLSLPLRHNCNVYSVKLSNAASSSVKVVVVVVPVLTAYFLVETSLSQQEVYNFKMNMFGEKSSLQNARNNFYYAREASELLMRKKLHSGIALNNKKDVSEVALWVEKEMEVFPRVKLVEDLINANVFLGKNKKLCNILDEAEKTYPNSHQISVIRNEKCILTGL